VAIDWAHLTQEEFDRIIEAYLTRRLAQDGEVVAYEGRGGDGGLDVYFVEPDGARTIYQLKYFPEGFSGGFAGRRQQIRRSFKAAMKHEPKQWVLVVPCKLTTSEHKFLKALPGREKPPVAVIVDHLDRPRLDVGLADYPDLIGVFTRNEVEEVARLWGQERAALTNGVEDLRERIAGLGRLAGHLDPYWDVAFSHRDGMVLHELRAKTPDAPLKSPISLHFDAAFAEGQAELQSKFVQFMEYGPSEALTLPSSSVKNFKVTGPGWISGERENVEVEWVPVPSKAVGKPLALRVLRADGRVASSHRGTVTALTAGRTGHTLTGNLGNGVMAVQFLLPNDVTHAGKLNFSFPSLDTLPADLLRALQLRRGLLSEPTMEVLIDGRRVGLLSFDERPRPDAEESQHFAILHEIADDLSRLQSHSQQEFPVPEDVSTLDRVTLRAVRLLLEGKCVVMPQAQRLTVTLSGEDSESLRAVTSGEPTALLMTQDDMGIELFGHEFSLGHVSAFNTRVACINAAEVQASLDTGRGSGQVAILEPKDGRHFRFFIPELWQNADAPLLVSPWSLTGVEEPPDVGDEIETARGLDGDGRPRLPPATTTP
jgi:hypothetical protein